MSQGYSCVLVGWSVGIPVGIRPMGHKYLFAEIPTDLGQALSVEKYLRTLNIFNLNNHLCCLIIKMII